MSKAAQTASETKETDAAAAPANTQQPHKYICSAELKQLIKKYQVPTNPNLFLGHRIDAHSIVNENDMLLRDRGVKINGGKTKVMLLPDPPAVPAQSVAVFAQPPQDVNSSATALAFPMTEYCVVNCDTVTASLALANSLSQYGEFCSDDVAALNFANHEHPGGYYRAGSAVKAQEETICRQLPQLCASLLLAQAEGRYPIPVNTALVTKKVIALRHPGTNDICFTASEALLAQQRELASTTNALDFTANPGLGQFTVISAAAPRGTADRRPARGWHNSEWWHDFVLRVRSVLNACVVAGAKDLVLGAWGAGAFGNPPKPVGEVFKAVLMTPEFRGKFRRVVFAIVDPMGTGNLKPFGEGVEGLA